MNEIDELKAELAELREATRLNLAIFMSVLATTSTSAAATKALAAALDDAERAKPRSDAFWEQAAGTLKMLSSMALRQHPEDQELLQIHHGVRTRPH